MVDMADNSSARNGIGFRFLLMLPDTKKTHSKR